jgi:hypothetical protein
VDTRGRVLAKGEPMTSKMKNFFYFLLFSALLGAVLVGWFAPSLISWYFTPPADLLITCKPAVEWGMSTYRKSILFGGILGLVMGAIIYFALPNSKKPKPPEIQK